MDKVRLGIIGVGGMGSGHSNNITQLKIPNLEITAICDINPNKIDIWKARFSNETPAFEKAEDLMDSGLCDAILIATPHYFHPVFAEMAMKKGLHVMCEKPAGVYTKQVEQMNECSKECDVTFGMMFNQRTNSLFKKMRELVQSGELGAIKRVNWIITTWYRSQKYYDSGAWRATWDGEGGGVLLNQCPHNLDLLQWICGMPSKVTAFCHEGKWHDIEVEDDVTAYLEYPNGATGVFVTSTADAPGSNRLEITLEMGKLIYDEDNEHPLTLYKLAQNEREYCKTTTEGFGIPQCDVIHINTDGDNEQHIGVLKAFVGNILNGTPLVAHGSEGINGLSLSNAMHLSSWTNKTVSLPIDADLFLEELNKKRASSKIKQSSDIVMDIKNSY